jgi:hypothetical protein
MNKTAQNMIDDLQVLAHQAKITGSNILFPEHQIQNIRNVIIDLMQPKPLPFDEIMENFNRGYKEGARDILNKLDNLTDEEIKERFFEFCQSSGTWRDFKRAILRKAQEK